jgi:hypothetical protein
VLLAGAAASAWAGRRGPGADALTVSLEGVSVSPTPDGSFDVTAPVPGGSATLVVTTAAGEVTAVTVP